MPKHIRKCLKCQENFDSEGIYNRICEHCKEHGKVYPINGIFVNTEYNKQPEGSE